LVGAERVEAHDKEIQQNASKLGFADRYRYASQTCDLTVD